MTKFPETTISATESILFETRFYDPDGDTLTFTYTSSDARILTVSEFPLGHLQLNKVGTGIAFVTITASDGKGGTVSDTFKVTVI